MAIYQALMLIFACFVGRPVEATRCQSYDVQVVCSRGPFAPYASRFLPDECDMFMYYQCSLSGNTWKAHHKSCAPCTVWSQGGASCVPYSGSCTATEDHQGYVEVIGKDLCRWTKQNGEVFVRLTFEDPAYYVIEKGGEHSVTPCAEGTLFNLKTCDCSLFTPDFIKPDDKITSIDFDSEFGVTGFSAPGGYWVSNNGVTVDPKGVKGKSGYFNGAAVLSIQQLANSYNYQHLSVSLWFKRTSGLSDVMGLLSNGACALRGSLDLFTDVFTDDSVGMRTQSDAGQETPPFYADILPGYWHHIALVYSYDRVSYFVDDDEPVVVGIVPGLLGNSPCPLTLGLMGRANYLTGHLDEVRLFKTALTKEQVSRLYRDID